MNVKLTMEFEVTHSNEADFKNLLGHLAQMAASSPEPAQPENETVPEVAMDPLPETDPEPAPAQPAPKRTRTRTKKADPAPEPEADPQPDPQPDPNLNPVEAEARQGQDPLKTYEKLPPKEKPKYTVEWVRRLLAEKVGKYRAECKQKLAELGAANVSSLDPEKYADFVDFLNTLSV